MEAGLSPWWPETEEYGGGDVELRRRNWAAWGHIGEVFRGQRVEEDEGYL